jgi:hypothetical protein
MLSDRTAKYVEAMIRLGPKFDYSAWLAELRLEGERARSARAPAVPSRNTDVARAEEPIPEKKEPSSSVFARHAMFRPVCSTLGMGGRRPTNHVAKWNDHSMAPDLSRVRSAFAVFKSSRNRDAIYPFLQNVYELVKSWEEQGTCRRRVRRILASRGLRGGSREPYAAVILATADVDAKTRSKWSRALRYVAKFNRDDEYFRGFMKRRGGINDCAAAFTARLGRRDKNR